ncbi:hypothetical protein K432DRAFT_416534 [Lepidopterella palustris CBS 459.81]|uniref:Uncharacterized protein n=1 Tax=Lepidopterella palustris CBS 459.81 TaxID=1314670 RepID=A0A8E2EBB4_9PEZI|nr:hypothetical protein K432DRAFT_416534 [Lepidopterella palustris CBS 459.81]
MRLGMGFNSYTQQLCVNDIVRKPGGVKASEGDLRSVDPQPGIRNPGNRQITSAQDAGILTKPTGTSIIKRQDGQSTVSQVVSWNASFVDKMSEVLDSLNISGALKISVDALGGGAGGAGEYLNSTAFTDSDATYKITVNVTNQKLVADDVSEFTPIPNVPAARFTEVYGDCFISGFIEGGVFNALVMKQLADKNEMKKMGGSLSIKLKLAGVADVEGTARADKIDNKAENKHSTTINLSWSGGGDIKPDDIKEWDIPTLTRVAMEFPDNVAASDLGSAILTKYSSLRSFHEQSVKGSPLDYENAGIYTSSLLDAYMEYKTMWKDIQQYTWDLDHGLAAIKARESDKNLEAFAALNKEDYDKRMAKYTEAKQALSRASGAYSEVTLEEPLPPNEVKPYPADLFGLDKARRDCRFEMIKIVREVNEVAADPKVATDPYRNWRYLSPNVFRRLLPTSKLVAEAKKEEDIEKLKTDLAASVRDAANSMNKVKEVTNEAETLKKQLSDREEEQKRISEEAGKQKEQYENQIQAELQKIKAEAAEIARLKAEAEKKLQEVQLQMQRDSDAAKSQLNQARADAEAARKERDEAKTTAASSQGPEHFDIGGNDIIIHSIIWGNKQILGNKAVDEKVRMYVNGRWGFSFNNDFFGCDPLPGVPKSGTIVYRRPGEGVKTVRGNEGNSSSFS